MFVAQKEEITMSSINPHRLLPHPFNERVYGIETLDAEFVKSIREHGVLVPIVVVSTTIGGVVELYILSGHRRVQAAKEVGRSEVPYQVLRDEGLLWQQEFLIEANRQRVKTPEQMAREYTETKRIELALADKRRSQGMREKGSASDRAAAKTGVDGIWARKMEVIVKAADEGNPVAIEGLRNINAGKATPESVYRALQPEDKDPVGDRYDQIAQRLQVAVGFFDVVYTPRAADPKHGFTFKARFVCEEEAHAFIELLGKIPNEAREQFERESKSWQK
jgi:hypothetical protein